MKRNKTRSQHIRRRCALILPLIVLLLTAGYLQLPAGVWQTIEPRVAAEPLGDTTPSEGEINTIAGIGGAGGFSGDGGNALLAQFNGSGSVAVAADGTVYIADVSNYRVRKVSGDIITTLVGNGNVGNSGNGGIGTAAEIGTINSIALDPTGHNLYIVDSTACVVRRVDVNPASATNGHIFAFAGTDCNIPAGIPGPAADAVLGFVWTVAVAPDGQVYIADQFFTCSISRIDTSGIIHHFAGSDCASTGDAGPAADAGFAIFGMAFDAAGNLFLVDNGFVPGTGLNANKVRRIDAATHIITTVAGGGSGTPPSSDPTDVNLGVTSAIAIDGNDLFVANGLQVFRLELAANAISVFAGTGSLGGGGDGGPAVNADFAAIQSLARRSGDLFISDSTLNRVRAVTISPPPVPIVDTIAGTGAPAFSGDGGPALAAELFEPRGMAVAPDGTIYFADRGNHRIRKIDTAGVISTIAGTGNTGNTGNGGPATSATLSIPVAVSLDPASNMLYFADFAHNQVRRIDLTAGTIHLFAGTSIAGSTGDGGLATSARLNRAQGVSVAPDGSVLIADTNGCRIRKVSGGIITTFAGTGVCESAGDGLPATSARFFSPRRVHVTPNGDVFVHSGSPTNDNETVRRIDVSTGLVDTVAGGGTTTPGSGPATTMNIGNVGDFTLGADGILYIGSLDRAYRVDLTTGLLSPFAGTGEFGFSGDGGPAIDATFQGIDSLAFRGDELIISDRGNNRLRAVNPNPSGCAAISLASTGQVDGAQHVPFSRTISASGGTGPYTYSLTGLLPAGLSLNTSTGEISGTPTEFVPGTLYLFTITATDASDCSESIDLSMTIEPFSCALVGNAPTAISGDLIIDGSTATTINLACLVSITGDLVVTNNAQAGVLDLGSLATVGGNVNISGNTAAGNLDLGSLVSVSGDLVITNNPAGDLDLSSLGTVSGNLDITNSHGSGDLDLGSLTSVGGNVNITENTTTGNLDISSLASVGGSVNIAENATSGDLDISALTSTGGTFRIASHGSAAVIGLTSLGTVAGSVDISGNSAVTTVSMGSLTTVAGDVTIEDNDSAAEVDLGSLQTADVISIGGNTNASLVDLASLGTAGEVTITNNGAAEVSLDLTSVSGNVTIDSNGEGTYSIGSGSVAGEIDLDLTGYTSVSAATAGGSTSIENDTSEAIMNVSLPTGSFSSPVDFSIVRFDPSLLVPEPGNGPSGSPATISPLAAYQYVFDIPSLNQPAFLAFTIKLDGLTPAARDSLIAALESDAATLVTKGDAPGSAYQAFPVCAAGVEPSVGGCVKVEKLDANGDVTTGVPTFVRFSGVVGHFSTWAVALVSAPTAAPASISGRVTDPFGRGIRGVAVVAIKSDGTQTAVVTNTFGNYRLSGLPAGETYVVSARSRRYQFENPTRIISLSDSITGEDFEVILAPRLPAASPGSKSVRPF